MVNDIGILNRVDHFKKKDYWCQTFIDYYHSYEKDDNNPWKVIDVGDWESRIDFESIYIYIYMCLKNEAETRVDCSKV